MTKFKPSFFIGSGILGKGLSRYLCKQVLSGDLNGVFDPAQRGFRSDIMILAFEFMHIITGKYEKY